MATWLRRGNVAPRQRTATSAAARVRSRAPTSCRQPWWRRPPSPGGSRTYVRCWLAADCNRSSGMEKFTRLTAPACPLDIANLNTDQLLPARFLKLPRAAGLGQFLLHDLRRDAQGRERPDFPLNRPAWREARIVVGRRNFGCGSSR